MVHLIEGELVVIIAGEEFGRVRNMFDEERASSPGLLSVGSD